MKLFLLLALLGCDGNIPALSITPDILFVPSLTQAAPMVYEDHIIRVGGLVGDFKLIMRNTSDKDLTDVAVIVTANNPEMVSDVIFSRIYHEIFWGGDLFVFDTPPPISNGEKLFIPFPGLYTRFQGDDIAPNSYVRFDSILLGKPGLVLHFQAYASLPGNHYALPMDATSVQWVYDEP